jgi:tRNA nucleotidyltransferase/poly(A) polymerase
MIPETKDAVRANAPLLRDKQSGEMIQAERSRDELFKLLDKPFAASGLRLMYQLGMLQIVLNGDPSPLELETQLGQVASLGMLASVISPQRDDNTASDLALGMAVIVLDRHRRYLQEFLAHNTAIDRNIKQLMLLAVIGTGFGSRKWIKRLMISSNEERLLELLVSGTERDLFSRERPNNREAYRFFIDFEDAGIGVILITLARYLAANHTALDAMEWGAILDQWASPLISCWFEKYDEVVRPIPVVTGDDLMQELHIKPGPIIGRLLEAIREEQAAGSIQARAEALALASQLLKEPPDHSS